MPKVSDPPYVIYEHNFFFPAAKPPHASLARAAPSLARTAPSLVVGSEVQEYDSPKLIVSEVSEKSE